uniref:Uncharacterized protein n=1 Tax=Anguilla anguilla TaxID=7936 RepID=A0A0E9TP37_ANGAN
MITLYLDIEFK